MPLGSVPRSTTVRSYTDNLCCNGISPTLTGSARPSSRGASRGISGTLLSRMATLIVLSASSAS